ncbi:hypothetical protein PoB_002212000 [Plakobranchus ocellatus]|uniref:Uncharacterized protein n=1 Tax=Plakobranchus ocellatus TaxID=259542 RepID=A0AAV3ZIZ4_9GAST|nr:hypothetical protein PoB_002212000 [Plakobranchus ocellatus]
MLHEVPEGLQRDTKILCSKEIETPRELLWLDALMNWSRKSINMKKSRRHPQGKTIHEKTAMLTTRSNGCCGDLLQSETENFSGVNSRGIKMQKSWAIDNSQRLKGSGSEIHLTPPRNWQKMEN